MKIVRRYIVGGIPYNSLRGMPLKERLRWADSVEASLVNDPAARAKRISRAFCIVFFPMFALAMLPNFSRVKVTVQYGVGWYIAFAVVMLFLAACFWGLRDKLKGQFFPKDDATPFKILMNIVLGVLGFGVLAGSAVFGGAPIVAHYLTAHPGELVVTVIRKDVHYQRYACSPRLTINEFTFFMRDHLCPSERAFGEIGEGSKLRLEGDVSPFGITVKRYYWKKNVSLRDSPAKSRPKLRSPG